MKHYVKIIKDDTQEVVKSFDVTDRSESYIGINLDWDRFSIVEATEE